MLYKCHNLSVIDTDQTRQKIQTNVSIIELMKAGSLFHLVFLNSASRQFICVSLHRHVPNMLYLLE